jgi:hypothetical protein
VVQHSNRANSDGANAGCQNLAIFAAGTSWSGSGPVALTAPLGVSNEAAIIFEVKPGSFDLSFLQSAIAEDSNALTAQVQLPNPSATAAFYILSTRKLTGTGATHTPISGFNELVEMISANAGGGTLSVGYAANTPPSTVGADISISSGFVLLGLGLGPVPAVGPVGPVGALSGNTDVVSPTVMRVDHAVPTGRLVTVLVAADNAGAAGVAAGSRSLTRQATPGTSKRSRTGSGPASTAARRLRRLVEPDAPTGRRRHDLARMGHHPPAKALAEEWIVTVPATKIDYDTFTANSTTTIPTVTTTPTAAGQLVIAALAAEARFTFVGRATDADTTNGVWRFLISSGPSSAINASNQTLAAQWKLVTAGGNQTFDPTIPGALQYAVGAIVFAV